NNQSYDDEGCQISAIRYDETIEWIPFDKLQIIQNISNTKFLAVWIDGIRIISGNPGKYIQSRRPSSVVTLITFSSSQKIPAVYLKNTSNIKFLAVWIDGIRLISGNPGEYVQSRRPSSAVTLMTFSGSPISPVDFLKNDEDDQDEVDELDEFYESDEFDEKSEICNKFWEADDIIQQQPITTQQNLDTAYTSQLIDVNEISKRFNAEIESGNIV
ncbi:35154_t:CDS:2, partial [Racocetra persica]